jgi:TonB family protein
MDWPDDEFEAFLRQFRPRKPRALPTHRRAMVALAAAAVIVVALIIPARFWSRSPAAGDFPQTLASVPPPATNSADGMGQRAGRGMPGASLNRVPDANATPPDAERSTTAVSGSPTLTPLRGLKPLGSTPSNGPVSASSGAANRRVKAGDGVKPPTKLVDVKPIYPEDARAAGIEGVVILGIVIGEGGSVIETRVLRSIPELDQAAIDAVIQWQFEPTRLKGEPVEVEMNVTINFTLR